MQTTLKSKLYFAVAFQTIINTSIDYFFGIASLMGLGIAVIIAGFLLNLLFKVSFLKLYILLVVGLISLFAIELMIAGMLLLVIQQSPDVFFQLNVYRITGIILSKTIYFFLLKKYIHKLDFFIHLRRDEKLSILLLGVLNIFLVFIAFSFYQHSEIIRGKERLFLVSIALAVVLFNIGFLNIINKMMKLLKKEAEWKVKEEIYQRRIFYLKSIEEIIYTMKVQRHDFNHHISCLQGLIELEEVENAKEYMKKITDEVETVNEIISIDPPEVAALLNIKKAVAEQKEIRLNNDINASLSISIDIMDFSTVLGNLIENAIEACEQLERKQRTIDLKIYNKNHYLIIKIINSKDTTIKITEEMIKKGYTTKSNREKHGIGLKSVREIVKKYHGVMKIKDEGNIFEVNIALSQK